MIYCKVNQLTLEDYININRFIQNNNTKHITDCFLQVIAKYTDYRGTISLIDGVVILLFLRSISIGASTTGKKNNVKIDISFMPLLENLQNLKIPKKEIKVGDLTAYIATPFSFEEVDYENFIYSVGISRAESQSLTVLEQKQLFHNLPACAVNKIQEFVSHIDILLASIDIYIADEKVDIKLLNNSLFEYIKFFYTENILSVQQKIIKIIQITQLDTGYLLSLPPAEINILYQFIIDEEKRQDNQSNNRGTVIPGTPRSAT